MKGIGAVAHPVRAVRSTALASYTRPVKPANAAPPSARQQPEVFSLAHLSDPHLSTLTDVRPSQLFNKRLLGYLSWRRRRRHEHRPEVLDAAVSALRTVMPDHVVVTGDLTHIGLPQEFEQVRAWLEGLGRPQDVTVIPGNHEAYALSPFRETLARWMPYIESDPGEGQGGESDTLFPSVRVRGPLALIGLSSARPTAPFLADGSVGGVQLQRLEGILDATRARGLVRVVSVHHPPLKGSVQARKRLRDAAALRKVLARCGAELVLHGHAHRPIWGHLSTQAGPLPVVGAASASELSDRPGRGAQFHVYRFVRGTGGLEITARVYRYEQESRRFADPWERVLQAASDG